MPRNHAAASSTPSAHRRRPAIRCARRAGVGQRGHLDRLLVERGQDLPRTAARRPGRRTDARRGSAGRAASPADRGRPRRARANSARRPRRAVPRPARRWRSSAAARATATPCRRRAGRPRSRPRSSALAPSRGSGSTASTSAAPSAANAIARRWGERSSTPRSNACQRPLAQVRHPRDGGAETPQRATPAVLDRCRVRPASDRTRRRLWNRPSGSCAASTNARYCSRRSSSSAARRRAADDHQRPRHVVEAVTVFRPRSVTLRVLVQPAGVGEPTQVRGRSAPGSRRARPAVHGQARSRGLRHAAATTAAAAIVR